MYVKKVTASTDNVLSAANGSNYSLKKAVLIGGSAASTATIFDGLQSGGIDSAGLASPIGDTSTLDFAPDEYTFKTAVSVTLTGTGAALYLYFE